MKLLLLPFALLTLFSSYPAQAEWHKQEQAIMGTQVSVELWHEKPLQANKCISLVMQNIHRIDAAMSPYKEQSELSRLNRTAANTPVKLSKELFQLIEKAQQVSEMTAGRFDITFASAGRFYDYRKGSRPAPDQLQSLVKAINYQHIQLDKQKRTVRFTHPQVAIDLGGIAKGHAVDQAIAILKKCGIKNALVSAGGDSRILGDKQGLPWMTGIRHPRQKDSFAVVLPLTNTAISTSGDYERFFMENGTRYHHILNPASGQPATTARSVTILGPDTTTTDALSTSVFVMGPDQGMKLIESLSGFEAIIVDTEGQTHYTSGLLSPE